MFGPTIERKYRVYRTAVRWGLSCALAGIAASSAAVITASAFSDRPADALSGPAWLLVTLGVAAVVDAAVDIFWIPRLVAQSLASGQARHWPAVFGEAARSGGVADPVVARLGMTAMLQLAGAFSPTVLGAIAYLTGSSLQVFPAFVGLSVVMVSAVFPRLRDWDDMIAAERASVASGLSSASVSSGS